MLLNTRVLFSLAWLDVDLQGVANVFFILAPLIFGAVLLFRTPDALKYAQVLVLGEIGHSPRMQYHALSLAQNAGYQVDVIGYPGSDPLEAILANSKIRIRYIYPLGRNWRRTLPFLLYAALKVFIESLQILWVLLPGSPRPHVVIVQSPPAIPSLQICAIVCKLRGSKFLIDFHNFGWTLLHSYRTSAKEDAKVKIGMLVKVAMWIEKMSSRAAWRGLCVSAAMKAEVVSWGVRPSNLTVLYDRPGPQFRGTLSGFEKACVLNRLQNEGTFPGTINVSEKLQIVISSTSWTPDEDFDQLLEALEILDKEMEKKIGCENMHHPIVLCITGKGPGRTGFVKQFTELKLSSFLLVTPWLRPKDYPLLLGCADVGISMHSSSSGFDLPMKVVDMLGAELPILAKKFPAISELIPKDGSAGMLFQTAEELAEGLLILLKDARIRENMRSKAKQWRAYDWNRQWEDVLPAMLEEL